MKEADYEAIWKQRKEQSEKREKDLVKFYDAMWEQRKEQTKLRDASLEVFDNEEYVAELLEFRRCFLADHFIKSRQNLLSRWGFDVGEERFIGSPPTPEEGDLFNEALFQHFINASTFAIFGEVMDSKEPSAVLKLKQTREKIEKFQQNFEAALALFLPEKKQVSCAVEQDSTNSSVTVFKMSPAHDWREQIITSACSRVQATISLQTHQDLRETLEDQQLELKEELPNAITSALVPYFKGEENALDASTKLVNRADDEIVSTHETEASRRIKHKRRSKNPVTQQEKIIQVDVSEVVSQQASPEQVFASIEMAKYRYKKIEALLTPSQWKVFERRAKQEMEFAEIATELGMKASTVYSHYSTAKSRIQTLFPDPNFLEK